MTVKRSTRHTANVFLPGCLGPVRREVILEDDHDEEIAALLSLNAELLEALADAESQIRSQLSLLKCDEEFIEKQVQKACAAIAKARSQS